MGKTAELLDRDGEKPVFPMENQKKSNARG
jgi:hypothetical protein